MLETLTKTAREMIDAEYGADTAADPNDTGGTGE